MKLERVMRKIIPSVARLSYNPIFKFLVDSVDMLSRHVYNEFSKSPPNHMRI